MFNLIRGKLSIKVEGFVRSGKTVTSTIILPYYLNQLLKNEYNKIFHFKITINSNTKLFNDLITLFKEIGFNIINFSGLIKELNKKNWCFIISLDEIQLLQKDQLEDLRLLANSKDYVYFIF
jgi:hypothetical protein